MVSVGRKEEWSANAVVWEQLANVGLPRNVNRIFGFRPVVLLTQTQICISLANQHQKQPLQNQKQAFI